MRQYNSYAIRYNVLNEIDKRLYKWIYIKGNMEVVALKRKYHPKTRINYRLSHGFSHKLSLPKPIAVFEEREDKTKYIKLLAEYTPVDILPISKLKKESKTII